jgi:hypothetical protein
MADWPNPDLRRKLERRFVHRASEVLAGRASLIGATQELLKLAFQLGLRKGDGIYDDLRLIASETARYPLANKRAFWADEALARLQPDIDRAEVWAREFGLNTCRSIVERYDSADQAS